MHKLCTVYKGNSFKNRSILRTAGYKDKIKKRTAFGKFCEGSKINGSIISSQNYLSKILKKFRAP